MVTLLYPSTKSTESFKSQQVRAEESGSRLHLQNSINLIYS